MGDTDNERFERVILPFLDDAYTLARYLTGDEHDAQDVVHDAVLRALRHFDGYAGGNARAWLLAIVRNCSHDWRTRKIGERRFISVDEDGGIELVDNAQSDARAIGRSERARIVRAVATLPVEFREVIVLREVEDMSYKEISEVIDAPIGTVMSRLSRARRQLARALGDSAQEAG